MDWLQDHYKDLAALYAGIVTVASIIVRLIPTLPEGHWTLPLVRFIAKFVALNNSVGKRPE